MQILKFQQIKIYANYVGIYNILSYIILKCFKIAPELVFIFILGGAILSQILRITLSIKQIDLNLKSYLLKVILPLLIVSLIATLAEVLILRYLTQGILRLALSILSSLILVGGSILIIRKKEAKHD